MNMSTSLANKDVNGNDDVTDALINATYVAQLNATGLKDQLRLEPLYKIHEQVGIDPRKMFVKVVTVDTAARPSTQMRSRRIRTI